MTIREYIKRKAVAAVRAAAVPHIEAAVDQAIKAELEDRGDEIRDKVSESISSRHVRDAVEGAIGDWEPTSRATERMISRAVADYDFSDAINDEVENGDYVTEALDGLAEEAVSDQSDAVRERVRELLMAQMEGAVKEAIAKADPIDLDADLPFGIEIPDSPEPAATAGA